jgi:hypothetical protein
MFELLTENIHILYIEYRLKSHKLETNIYLHNHFLIRRSQGNWYCLFSVHTLKSLISNDNSFYERSNMNQFIVGFLTIFWDDGEKWVNSALNITKKFIDVCKVDFISIMRFIFAINLIFCVKECFPDRILAYIITLIVSNYFLF